MFSLGIFDVDIFDVDIFDAAAPRLSNPIV